ncbi:threonine ammonia-lyase IlvA [Kribbia dieselivorans]|uniref:threonine ammonia-lyase IlvA n=1 Tax=Kribbia dieselivorans TaxID=331526 RepID=UPI000ADE35E3|nr:threonine ammonia-lyase IlvA [Kribbia dieselivorans]
MPNSPTPVTATDVEHATARLKKVIEVTNLRRSRRLSEATGAEVLLKREDQQGVRSYKVRGATNLIDSLTPAERERGVTCASAGNHAQGVAFACAQLGVQARIYLPRTTPRQKRDRVASIGGEFAELILIGETYDQAAAAAAQDSLERGTTLVHAFDDPTIIAGQGTVALEIIRQLDTPPDVIVVPVGGGGLISGCLAWLGERYPEVRVIGVEPAGAASMAAALEAGHPVDLEHVDPFVDGAAVGRVGEQTFPIVQAALDAGRLTMVAVDEGAVCVEMLALYQVEGIIAEPAGALASAALAQIDLEPGSRVVAIVSGGNNDVSRYADIVERALVYEGRKHWFLVDFPQEPGSLRRFLDEVLGPDDDITHFEYTKRNNRDTGPALVGIELGSAHDLLPLLARMETSRIHAERVDPASTLFHFLI